MPEAQPPNTDAGRLTTASANIPAALLMAQPPNTDAGRLTAGARFEQSPPRHLNAGRLAVGTRAEQNAPRHIDAGRLTAGARFEQSPPPHIADGDRAERDAVLDTLLGPGAQVRSGRGDISQGCTLVGGIGLPWLRDLDFGMNWLARAASLSWPDNVVLEDLSYAAHRVLHRLQELLPARVVLLGCMPRDGQTPGTIRRYLLSELPEPDPEEVRERLGEAVGGIVDLDHTLVVCRYWGALPVDTVVIEVEPADREFGWGFSEPVEDAVASVLDMVRSEVTR